MLKKRNKEESIGYVRERWRVFLDKLCYNIDTKQDKKQQIEEMN